MVIEDLKLNLQKNQAKIKNLLTLFSLVDPPNGYFRRLWPEGKEVKRRAMHAAVFEAG